MVFIKGGFRMVSWKNLDTLAAYEELSKVEAVKLADYFEVSLDEICGREAK